MGGRDDQDLYKYAGKGAKHRERLRRADSRRLSTSSPLAENEGHLTKRLKRTAGPNEDAVTIKEKIRLAVIDHDMSHERICKMLKKQGHILSDIAAANVRADTRETLKLMLRAGLLNREDLARHRRKHSR
ncbi:hypothetical protein N2605_17525 [Bradyrhizobium yuanmingense]|uniref:hypothetical protein n=1 Tax=Bradyrhizobium yuanmingense TaxID=108015 RepID=UPI0021A527AB|nr:hypothetical protein [Bradyrhizobium sp. CB1024]UWU88172.1 hypothetical protein N2605_17525 [Bradyrhizobium sp. CB1024]